jgi:hypothetical protein
MKRLASLQLSALVMTVGLFAGSLMLSGFFSATASAQTTTTTCYPTCTTVVTPPVTTGPPSSLGTVPDAPSSSSSLAFTGVDVAGIAFVAVILIAGGLLVLRIGRRRRRA